DAWRRDREPDRRLPVTAQGAAVMSETQDIGIDALRQLALNLRWSWGRATDELWAQLDPELWALTHNPWAVLQTASPRRVQDLLARPEYRQRVKDLLDRRHQYLTAPAWFQQAHGQSPLSRVAYFSMEFALSEALPIYSGGLGNVAGDQLKAASDLGVPVTGVGVLYQEGYFRQVMTADGSQEALYPYNDPDQLPITPVRSQCGDLLRLPVELPGYRVWLRAWQVQVGRVVLYLLDSNDPANPPAVRGITSELYGGGTDLRLQQELVLGIGGWRLLRTLGLEPAVRGSGAVNGVSRLHGQVSRRIFQSLFPRWPNVEVPVAHVTNGIHTPSWESPEADALWTKTCGAERWRQTLESIERDAASA